MQLYTGTVVYPVHEEPYKTDWGPKFNVKVSVDGPIPREVRVDDSGYATIWSRADDPETGARGDLETPYMVGLRAGDPVQLALNKRGTGFNLVLPPGAAGGFSQPAAPPPVGQPAGPAYQPAADSSSHQATATSNPSPLVWYPLSAADVDTIMAIAEQTVDLELELMTRAQIKAVQAGFPDLPPAVLQDIAVTGLIQARREFRPGMVAYQPVELTGSQEQFLAGVDSSSRESLVASVLDGLAKAVPVGRDDLVRLLKSFGLSGDDITGDQGSWLRLLAITTAYYAALAADQPEDAARRQVEGQFGLASQASLF